jgi:peptidoglycan/xylan/chitin deacetylase (PgdA/CDA1 family)
MRSFLGGVETAARPLTAVLGSVVAVDPRDGYAQLTFDDGPTPGETDLILPVLAERAATATFFVLVNRAARDPQLLREVLAGGHELALHGPDHRRITTFRPDEVARRTRDARRRLEDLAGVPIRWYRPPYGKLRVTDAVALRGVGLVPVLWEAGMYDWSDLPQEERLSKGLSETRPGSVVLMHDGFAGPADGVDDGPDPRVDRADLVRRTLDGLEARGLRCRSVGAALAHGEAVKRPRFAR